MKSTQMASDAGSETRVVILDSGEEAFATLTKFANDTGLTAASLTAIGAFERATIGWAIYSRGFALIFSAQAARSADEAFGPIIRP